MSNSSSKLQWCIIRLGSDFNWWVEEISDEIHWDVDGLSIIDPKQVSHLLDLTEPIREYDFQPSMFEEAFFKFRIDRKLDDQRLRLVRVSTSLLDSDEPLFALPDLIDEDKSPYADLLDHLTRLRVKMLNDLIDSEQKFTVEELEEQIREEQNAHFLEGIAIHVFKELTDVIEFVPDGYEVEDEGTAKKDPDEEFDNDFPEIDEEDQAKLEGDESLEWDDDDDFHKPQSDEDEDGEDLPTDNLDDLEDDDDDDFDDDEDDFDDEDEDLDDEEPEEDEEDAPKKRRRR